MCGPRKSRLRPAASRSAERFVTERLLDNEFDLIARYFSRPAPAGMLGVGDDCALLPIAPGKQLATSTDMLLEGRHFFSDADAQALGHKALAVNLSDLAAMGARPVACVLGLALPRVDHDWLAAFSDGFYALAEASGCVLVGGDTTRGLGGISISVTVFGEVAAAQALRRDAAQAGDDIWVTGCLGAAAIALQLLDGTLEPQPSLLAATRHALERPEPPMAFAQSLAGLAHAAVDISDGLVQDLGHILKASHCAAELDYAALPVCADLAGLPAKVLQTAVLAGGDVYQLCFTAPAKQREAISQRARRHGVSVSRVGCIVAGSSIVIRDADGKPMVAEQTGFNHFS